MGSPPRENLEDRIGLGVPRCHRTACDLLSVAAAGVGLGNGPLCEQWASMSRGPCALSWLSSVCCAVLSVSKETCYFWGFQFYFREFPETLPGLVEMASPPGPFYRQGVIEAPGGQRSEQQSEPPTREVWAGGRDLLSSSQRFCASHWLPAL